MGAALSGAALNRRTQVTAAAGVQALLAASCRRLLLTPPGMRTALEVATLAELLQGALVLPFTSLVQEQRHRSSWAPQSHQAWGLLQHRATAACMTDKHGSKGIIWMASGLHVQVWRPSSVCPQPSASVWQGRQATCARRQAAFCSRRILPVRSAAKCAAPHLPVLFTGSYKMTGQESPRQRGQSSGDRTRGITSHTRSSQGHAPTDTRTLQATACTWS